MLPQAVCAWVAEAARSEVEVQRGPHGETPSQEQQKRKIKHHSFVSRGCILVGSTLVFHVTVTGKKMACVLCDGPDSVTCLQLWVFRSEGKITRLINPFF